MAIKFDYNQTVQQAKLLDDLANDMTNKAVKKMNTVIDNLEAGWSGKSAQKYINFVADKRSGMETQAKYLRDVADFLRKAAKQMKEAEDQAKAAAQNI